MLVAAAFALLGATDLFYAQGPYDGAIPRPDQILGYAPGARHTVYMDQQRVLEALAAKAPGRAKLIPFGETAEKRGLRVMVIGSPENMKRIEAIRKDIQVLADGTLDETVVKNSPAIVWVNETIHGNETASFESGMYLIYNLIASRSPHLTAALKNVVVIVNPCYNPDGHERNVVWYNSVARGDEAPLSYEAYEPRILNGRLNHYRFDMNRDRVAMSQAETKAEVAEFLKWNPQVYVDQHGQVETYFFPPTSQSINARVDRDRYNKWTNVFGRATGKAFDDLGFNYYVRDVFDLYYPGYLDSWSTLSGAIGMTQETNASILSSRDADGAIRTLRDGMERHFTSALAVIESAASNREALLRSFSDYKHRSAEGKDLGDHRVMLMSSNDRTRLERLKSVLDTSKITSTMFNGTIRMSGHSVWANRDEAINASGWFLTVSLQQPQGSLAQALLETETQFEPEFVQEQQRRRAEAKKSPEYAEGSEFYDQTAWSLPLCHGVQAWWITNPPAIPMGGKPGGMKLQPSSIGYSLRPNEVNTIAVAKLLANAVRVSQTPRTMKLGETTYPAGTYLVLKSRNDEGYEKKLVGIEAEALTTAFPEGERYSPGSESVNRLRPFRCGVLFGTDSAPSDFGSVWFVLERQLNIPFIALHNNALRGDLGSFSCLIAPEGADVSSAKIRDWVMSGGCLILLGGDPNRGGFLKLERQNSVSDPGDLAGSLFRADLDPRSFLSYGYEADKDGRIPVAFLVSGSSYYRAPESGAAAKFADSDEPKLLSGWTWPDETERALRNVVAAQVDAEGSGRVVWFASDPTERCMYPGQWQMLLNAMVSGPRP